MRIDDEIPFAVTEKCRNLSQVELFDRQHHAIRALLARFAGTIHQVVKVTQGVRRLVDEIEIGLAVHAAEGSVRLRKHIDVLDMCVWQKLLSGELDRLS